MPAWLLQLLINVGVIIVQKFGVPWLLANCPKLAPLLEEILKVIGGKAEPSQELLDCSHGYCVSVGRAPELKK